MDLFNIKKIKPMLIGVEKEATDDKDYINELKLDGIRCIAYLDKNSVDLRNKRNDKVLFRYPEISNINKQIKCDKLILDGELIILKENRTDFYEIKKRSLMTNKFKIELHSNNYPVSFVAFDILYKDGEQLTELELIKRKDILNKSLEESKKLSISRYLIGNGIELYNLAEENELEGIVSKRKNSKYYFDKRTKDWIKIKCYEDKEFVIIGYSNDSIMLGEYDVNGNLDYKGRVSLGISNEEWQKIKSIKEIDKLKEDIIIDPILVCTVKYMKNSKGLRQAVFKGLREDKIAKEIKRTF